MKLDIQEDGSKRLLKENGDVLFYNVEEVVFCELTGKKGIVFCPDIMCDSIIRTIAVYNERDAKLNEVLLKTNYDSTITDIELEFKRYGTELGLTYKENDAPRYLDIHAGD